MGVYIWTGTPQTRTEYANYTFDDQSNSQITDTSGNGKNLTGGTMPTYSLVSGTNYAGVFTNANTSALAPSVGVASLSGDFTMLVWVKPTVNSASYVSCIIRNNGQEAIQHQISLIWGYNSGQFEYYDDRKENGDVTKRYTIKSGASLNTWYLIGFVRSYDGTTVKTYCDGALVGTNTSQASSIEKTLYLGSSEVGDRFRGQIGECFVAEGVFTDADVLDYYNQTKGNYNIEDYEYSYDFRNKTLAQIQADGFSVKEGNVKLNANGISSNTSNARIIVNHSIQSLNNAKKLTIIQNCILSSGSDAIRLNGTGRTYATGIFMDDTQNTYYSVVGGTNHIYSGMSAGTYTQELVINFESKTATMSCTGKSDHTESVTDTEINNIYNNINNIETYVYGSNCYIKDFSIVIEY